MQIILASSCLRQTVMQTKIILSSLTDFRENPCGKRHSECMPSLLKISRNFDTGLI